MGAALGIEKIIKMKRVETLIFLTNQVNHHQIYVADEFYKVLGSKYRYIATEPTLQEFIASGYPELDRPYITRAYLPGIDMDAIQNDIDNADVVIIGSAPDSYVKSRLNQNKITFHYSERWFKKISYHIFSPRLWKYIYEYHFKFRNFRSYMLCASAFTSKDVNSVFCYPHKCFKWGYFPKVDELDIDKILLSKHQDNIVKIMWCARFLKWKHPELPVKLAKILKRKHYNIKINMFGNGPEHEHIAKLIQKYNIGDIVRLCGNQPNEMLLKTYREHHIFIFTSDRNEGWGAVLNEAMSNGCAVVASDKIGSAPFLINDGENGFLFKSENLRSLTEKVEKLIYDIELREKFSKNAYYTMRDVWSPENAAYRFLTLSNSIINGFDNRIFNEGPCSKI